MKIINLLTNIIFDLPQKEATKLLSSAPDIFAKVGKNNKVLKPEPLTYSDNSVLSKIIDN